MKNEHAILQLPTIYNLDGAYGSEVHKRQKWLKEMELDLIKQRDAIALQLELVSTWESELTTELCDRCDGAGEVRIELKPDGRHIRDCTKCKGSGFHKLSPHMKG